MADSSTKTSSVKKELESFTDAMNISIDYVQPQWETHTRMYEFWRGIKPDALDSTLSGIWLNIFNQLVQNRLPLLFENVFSHPEYLTLKSDSPEYDFSVLAAQTWLRDLLDEKIKIRSSAYATLQSACIGGTGFRMPYVRYAKRNGQQVPIITSKNLDFFNVLPSPNGSLINPEDHNSDNAIDWMFVVDWWTEEKIELIAKFPGANKDQIGKLLEREYSDQPYNEDDYKNQFKTINGQNYDGYGDLYDKVPNLSKATRKRRIVHWFRRDKHIIVAEDLYVLYSGEGPIGKGVIPVVKYAPNPDMNNFYGISQLEMVEDLVMAMIMTFNYRMDHMLGVMFPTAWIRDDVRRGKSAADFAPSPYAVTFFPSSVTDISKAIHYDRRPEVSPQAFVEEDRMKALLQGISGELETTGSMQDVVGNKTATGVTTIASQLKSRPNMEAAILEEQGFRPECELLLKLGDKHINRATRIRVPATPGASQWQTISPHAITDKYTVQMHGSKWFADQSVRFQKSMAIYPMMSNKPGIDQFQLDLQMLNLADVFPEPEKIVTPPAPPTSADLSVRPSGQPQRPGGVAAQQDLGQQAQSVRERQTVEPGTGAQRRAF